MAIVRWSPWRDVVSVDNEVSRMFDSFLSGNWSRWPSRVENWSPAIDVEEDENGFTLTAEVPGMAQKDIKVSIIDDVLTIKGEKKLNKKEEKEGGYRRIERCFGTFERSFTLNTPVEAGKVEASYKNGVLEIRLPKAEQAKPKEIAIEVK
jgi:HSP20 family protein